MVATPEMKSATALPAERVKSFAASLRGQLIDAASPDYEQACRVYNGMIQKRPLLIVRCSDTTDVIQAVNFARENTIEVAIRGGGHNGAGLGTCDGGLVIDLSLMKGVRVDPTMRTARVAGGCTWGDVDHATNGFGLATPSGILSTTGVGGLTLGGGLGHLTRQTGLAIDNLLEVDMVLADGSFVTCNAKQNTDLFWAVRGGGGNFGVVTSFVFRLHPISTVYAGPMLWPIEQAADVMRFWRDYILQAPSDINGFFAFLCVPPGPPFPEEWRMKNVCGVVWCYTGPLEKAEEVFKPIRSFRTPIVDFVGPIPHPALQSMFDPLFPPGQQWYWRADFVKELSEEAIQQHVEYGSNLPTWQSTMHLYPINGVAHQIGRQDTAFSYRDANWGEVIVGVDPDPANNDRMIAWAKAYWEALHPYSAGGAYVNMMMDEGPDRVKAAYRDNYERLSEIKRKYDPNNFFHVNQNIKPSG